MKQNEENTDIRLCFHKVVEDASKNVSSMTENGAVSDSNGVIGDETVDVEETTETVPDTSTAPTASDMNE